VPLQVYHWYHPGVSGSTATVGRVHWSCRTGAGHVRCTRTGTGSGTLVVWTDSGLVRLVVTVVTTGTTGGGADRVLVVAQVQAHYTGTHERRHLLWGLTLPVSRWERGRCWSSGA